MSRERIAVVMLIGAAVALAAGCTSTGGTSAAGTPVAGAMAAATTGASPASKAVFKDKAGWIPLFDGKTLNGWTTKIVGYPAGQDPLETFRVKDGAIVISYDKYGGDMKMRWAHLFYNKSFKAYRLSLEYKFEGDEMLPLRRTQWNSGVLHHSQSPESMTVDQPYPISAEAQILGYFPVPYRTGKARMTSSACGLGTALSWGGVETQDCFTSRVPTKPNDQWVLFELEVRPDGIINNYIDGELATSFDHLLYDTSDARFPSQKFIDAQGGNREITSGYICFQSEGHPVEFRNIRILPLN